MTPSNSSDPDSRETDTPDDPVVRGEEVLDRAREVARRIAERVKKVAGDTNAEIGLGPTDETAQSPSLQPPKDSSEQPAG